MSVVETRERIAVREKEALELLGMGRSLFLQKVYSGEIPSYSVGRARFFRVDALREWAARQEQEQRGDIA